ncbi:MAG: nucleotidyltransferase domain-containing protein [Patescibacteria group bacterium]
MFSKELLAEKFIDLAVKNGLILGVLFGSQATGKTHSQSDIDVGFVADRRLGLREIAEIQENLMVATGYGNIEMVDLKNVPPLLLKYVAEEGILLYEKEVGDFDRLKIYGIKLYMEAQPLYRARSLELKRFLLNYGK